MRTAKSRQKNYADVRRRSLEFEIGDPVFLKVTPMKDVLRFGRKGKLSPKFIGPFEILERVGPVAYKLALPQAHSGVHDVFHVLMLRKYITDPIHEIDYEPLQLNEDLSFEEKLVKILAREVKTLRNRNIAFVKVLWQNHHIEEATWEREGEIREKYPELVRVRDFRGRKFFYG